MVSGCADYLNHRDTVTLGAGNAMEANIGIHTEDPFPIEAWDTNIDAHGHPVARAQRLYRGAPPAPVAPAS